MLLSFALISKNQVKTCFNGKGKRHYVNPKKKTTQVKEMRTQLTKEELVQVPRITETKIKNI